MPFAITDAEPVDDEHASGVLKTVMVNGKFCTCCPDRRTGKSRMDSAKIVRIRESLKIIEKMKV